MTRDLEGHPVGPRACLAMLDPQYGGGILTLLRELCPILIGWGIKPRLLFRSISDNDLQPRRLLRRLRLWDVRCRMTFNLPSMALGHVPAIWLPLRYFWPYPVVQRYIRTCDMHIVVGGALRGTSFALAQKRYLIWTPTLALDEYKAKAEAEDLQARQLVAARWLPLLVWQERIALRRASLILATSNYTAARITTVCPDVANRVRIVPCPVEIPTLFPSSGKLDAGQGKKDVLCVGRLQDPRKNLPLLLQAFHEVSKQRSDIFLRLVGGTDKQTLEKWLTRLKLRDRVIDMGKVSDTELKRQYLQAAVFVLPSRQEGLGIVVLEAMAAGVPVVSTRCGGPEDHVIDGETGYLVPSNEPMAMAQAILRLLNNDSLRRRMGDAARDYAQRTFSRPVVEMQFRRAFEQVYPEILANL